MKNTLSFITILPTSKADRDSFIRSSVEEIINGGYFPLHIAVKLKSLKEIVSGIRSNESVRQALVSEASRQPNNTFECHGSRITRTCRRQWSYDRCNDSVLADLHSRMNDLQSAIRQREAFLRALKPGILAFDEFNGKQLFPPSFKVSTSLHISIR